MKTMKKAISVLLLVCMVSALCSAGAYATGDFSITLDKPSYTTGTDNLVTATATLPADSTATDYNISWYVNSTFKWSNNKNGQLFASWNLSDLSNGDKIYATATKDNETTLTSDTVTVVKDKLTASITQSDNTLTVTATKGGSAVTTASVTWSVTDNNNITLSSLNDSTTTIASNNIYEQQTGTVKATVTYNGESADATISVTINATGIHVNSVTLSPQNPALVKGSNVVITATIAPANATEKDNVQWTINPEVLNVNSNGVFTVKDDATVTNGQVVNVTATVDGQTDTVPVTITVPSTPAESLKVSAAENKTSIYNNATVQLSYTVNPTGAGVKDVTWKSSDTQIATVDKNGLVTGVKSGKATITATATDINDTRKTVNGTIEITVTPKKVAEIELVSTTKIEEGNKQTITATALPADAENKALTWGSDKPDVASVEYSGDGSSVVITANKVGTATITATAADESGVSAKCTVEVTEPAAYRVVISPNSLNLVPGNIGYFTATIVDKSGKNVSGADKTLSWSFSGDSPKSITYTDNGYNATNGCYSITVSGRFNRNYNVYASWNDSSTKIPYTGSASITVSFTPTIIYPQKNPSPVYNGRDALSFMVNDAYENFISGSVYVDGQPLSDKYYTRWSYGDGYLVVTLNQSFLNFLCQYYNNNGYHTISIGTKYGTVSGNFRTWGTASSFNGVKTGDDAAPALWAALLAVSAVGAGAAVVIYKRRKTGNG